LADGIKDGSVLSNHAQPKIRLNKNMPLAGNSMAAFLRSSPAHSIIITQ
jgi:hypothetical protein